MSATPIDRRVCVRCKQSKPRDQFGWIEEGEPFQCRACKEELRAAAEYARVRRANNPETVRAMNLWRLYKIRPEEYDALREAQNFCCATCEIHEGDIDLSRIGGRPRKDGTKSAVFPLQVDHCHDTGEVRGLLCPSCNKGLGHFRDDVKALLAAAAYIEAFRAERDLATA